VLADSQPITVKWTPATIPGISVIFISIDISYHAGTLGVIECNCDDNGSVTIPASLIDKLKALGTSGFPKLEISRRSVGTNSTTNARFVIESQVVIPLQIPGVISCDENDPSANTCPEGYICGGEKKCVPIAN
jgi:hypothetical protein